MNVILITQNLFRQGRFWRDNANCQVPVHIQERKLKDTVRLTGQRGYIEDGKDSYLDDTRQPRVHLLLDVTQVTDNFLRFRTELFPSVVTVFYDPVGQESSARHSRVGAHLPMRKI